MTQDMLERIDLAHRHFAAMASGAIDDLAAIVHPRASNREAVIEPPACRGEGPAAWAATSAWLHQMAPDVTWEVHEVIAHDDLVAVHCIMSGTQTGQHEHFDADGNTVAVMPPTGRRFQVTQSHWLRVADGKIIEHWANRDDLGMARQLGWL